MTKLKVSFLSDLHLEFGYQSLPGGDVLILAGDICEARNIQKDFNALKPETYEPGKFPHWDFFKFECAKYNKVFYVMGNHEHYHGKLHKTYDTIKSMLPSNVVLLEKEYFEYNGVVFLGGTLWTDLNKGDPITVFTVKDYMSDYKYIQNYYPNKGLYHKLTPEFTALEFRKTKEYFKFALEENRTNPVVVITHMAPSFQSVNAKYKDAGITNAAYASELSDFILDNENIKFWIHGHMHNPVDYMIGNTKVLSNPRGYVPWELGNGFNLTATFDIEI